jgi:hypothetical protein
VQLNDEKQSIVTIRRFRDLSEAIVARGALEASGIPCFLRNENTVRIDWQISNAIGGIRLDVLESDRDTAEAALTPTDGDRGPAVQDDETYPDPDRLCPSCASASVHRKHRWAGLAMAAILALGVPFPRGPREWTCDDCGARWIDNEPS